MKKEELIKKYLENEEEIKRLRNDNRDVLCQISSMYEHKVGEIIKWTKPSEKRLIGYFSHNYKEIPEKEISAVLVSIKPRIDQWGGREPELFYGLEFKSIKKDGGISQNSVHVNRDEIIWTGEIHKDYIDKARNEN